MTIKASHIENATNWYIHGRSGRNDLNVAHVLQMTQDIEVGRQYAGSNGSIWAVDVDAVDTDVMIDMRDAATRERVLADLRSDCEAGLVDTDLIDLLDARDAYGEPNIDAQWDDIVNPADIVDTAGLWDSPAFVAWYWDRYEISLTIVESGALLLDPALAVRVDDDTFIG